MRISAPPTRIRIELRRGRETGYPRIANAATLLSNIGFATCASASLQQPLYSPFQYPHISVGPQGRSVVLRPVSKRTDRTRSLPFPISPPTPIPFWSLAPSCVLSTTYSLLPNHLTLGFSRGIMVRQRFCSVVGCGSLGVLESSFRFSERLDNSIQGTTRHFTHYDLCPTTDGLIAEEQTLLWRRYWSVIRWRQRE